MTAASLLESELGDFESFIRRHRRKRESTRRQRSAPAVPPAAVTAERPDKETVTPADGFLLRSVSHVAFHQKIRRAFLARGVFRFDGIRQDIDIKQVENIVTIDVNVGVAPEAKAVALEVWDQMRRRMLDAEWGLELDEVVFSQDTQRLHILFGSDKLFTKRLSL